MIPSEKKDFFKYLNKFQIKFLVSWTQYDSKVLFSLLYRARKKINFIDACQRTANCIIWNSYSLEDIYNALFPNKEARADSISGYFAGLYGDHLILPNKKCQYCAKNELRIIDQIKEKNRSDIIHMVEICELLWKKPKKDTGSKKKINYMNNHSLIKKPKKESSYFDELDELFDLLDKAEKFFLDSQINLFYLPKANIGYQSNSCKNIR